MVWVLESAYGYDKATVIAALERLLSTHELEVEDADVALAALHDYRHSTAGFTDCLIGHRNAAHGCRETGSFDKRAKRVAGFRMLSNRVARDTGICHIFLLSFNHITL